MAKQKFGYQLIDPKSEAVIVSTDYDYATPAEAAQAASEAWDEWIEKNPQTPFRITTSDGQPVPKEVTPEPEPEPTPP